MQKANDYVVVVATKNVTNTSRVIDAPNVAVAIAKAMLQLSPGGEVRSEEIVSVRAYKCITIGEEVDYAF